MVRQLPPGHHFVRGSATVGRTLLAASDGALWIYTRDGMLFRRASDGSWSGGSRLPDGDEVYVGIAVGQAGTIFAFSAEHVYRAYPDGRVERIASVRGAIQAIDRSDGSTAIDCFAQGAGFVYELEGGVVREIDRFITRFMAVVERRGVLWIAYDTQLVQLDDGEPREIFATRNGLTRGGSLRLNHEGSLWIGTMRGLLQLPESDSMSWQSEAPVGGIQLLSDRSAPQRSPSRRGQCGDAPA
jgi:ligand-binding sensor domain-containing protein